MEKNTVKKNKPLDIKCIQKKLFKCYKYTEDAKGCDLIVLIGNTGAGKSTTCNYLLGEKMKEEKHMGKSVVETVIKTGIKIGHEVKSETLYAKSVKINYVSSTNNQNGNSICLLDCPGFLGNKTREEKVIESISTELALRNAREIKGILILISINDIMESRLGDLRQLVKTLVSLFKNPLEMVQYSIFVVTKKNKYMPEEYARQATIGTMESLKQYCEKQSTYYFENQNLSSSEGLTHIEYDRIATYFAAVLEKQNIVFIDPLDNGESRKLIFDRINGIEPRREQSWMKNIIKSGYNMVKKMVSSPGALKPITINDFNFSDYEENRISFNKAMYDIADHGYQLINKVLQDGENIQNFSLEISNLTTRLLELQEHKFNAEEDLQKIMEKKDQYLKIEYESVKSWKSMILQNDHLIESKRSKIEEILTEEEKINKELATINTDAPLQFIKKNISECVSWWKLFGWEEMKFIANTEDKTVPIIKVEKVMQNGKWIDENDKRQSGIYEITYQSKYRARPAVAKVTTYIKTKDEAGNKICIKNNKAKISQLMNNKANLKEDIDHLMSRNLTLKSNIEESENSTNTRENMIKILKKDLQKYNKDIEYCDTEIVKIGNSMKHTKVSGLANLSKFKKNQFHYDILIGINKVLQFPSLLITQFVSEYSSFVPDNYEFVFTEMADVNFESFISEENKTLNLENVNEGETEASVQNFIPSQQTFAKFEVNQMSVGELEDQKSKLSEEIQHMKEQLEVKETQLNEICHQLEKLQTKNKTKKNVKALSKK